MAIQNRRGVYNDFDPSKLVAGEWAVVQSGDPNSTRGKAVYIAFNSGDVERMATYEDMEDNIDSATATIQNTLTQNVSSFLSDAGDTVDGLESDVASAISSAQSAVSGMQSDVSSAISSAQSTMSGIQDDYTDLENANADQLQNMQGQITNAIADTVNASNTALESAATANEVAEEIRRIIDEGGTVVSVFGRSGAVVPQSGDYNSSQVAHGSGSVADALTFDSTPTAGSAKAVQSGGVYSRIYDINQSKVDMTTPKYNFDTTAAAGTTDGDLYAAITALGWESEVIV